MYPQHNRLMAQMSIEIRLPVKTAFAQEMQYLIRRGHLHHIRVFMELRRPEDGLLVYKLCIEIQDDERKGKQKTMRKALAKHVYAFYLAAHYPQNFKQIAPQLGDFSFDGDKQPT